jgi:hypothetical protein
LQSRPAKVSRSPTRSEARKRSPATIDRDMVPLPAALNRAFRSTGAQLSGTSVAMIERFYGHLQHDQAAAALAQPAL